MVGRGACFCDDVIDHRPEPRSLNLGHVVRLDPAFLHPLGDLGRGPVSADADLDEGVARDRPFLDQLAHLRSVIPKPVLWERGGVGVGVELDDTDTSGDGTVEDAENVRIGDSVIAADDDRNGARGGDLSDERSDVLVCALWVSDDHL